MSKPASSAISKACSAWSPCRIPARFALSPIHLQGSGSCWVSAYAASSFHLRYRPLTRAGLGQRQNGSREQTGPTLRILPELWRVVQKGLQGFVGWRYPLLLGILLFHICGRDLAVRAILDEHFGPPNRPPQAIPNQTSRHPSARSSAGSTTATVLPDVGKGCHRNRLTTIALGSQHCTDFVAGNDEHAQWTNTTGR